MVPRGMELYDAHDGQQGMAVDSKKKLEDAEVPGGHPGACSDSDEGLVRRVQQGDKEAYSLLVIRYQHRVIELAYRYAGNQADARDIAQEALVKAYRAISTFRGESSFYTWLYRIVVNTARNYMEVNRRFRGGLSLEAQDFSGQDAGQLLVFGDTPDQLLETDELQAVIMKAMSELPADQRQAITLREIEGLSYEDIARTMNIPLGTVRSRIFRARRYIEGQMQALLPDK